MTATLLEVARRGDEIACGRLVQPHHGELRSHRMFARFGLPPTGGGAGLRDL